MALWGLKLAGVVIAISIALAEGSSASPDQEKVDIAFWDADGRPDDRFTAILDRRSVKVGGPQRTSFSVRLAVGRHRLEICLRASRHNRSGTVAWVISQGGRTRAEGRDYLYLLKDPQSRDPEDLKDALCRSVRFEVVPVNEAPRAHAQTVVTAEDRPIALTLSGSDPDGDRLRYELVQGPRQGTLSGEPPKLSYRPKPNYHGPDRFTFRVSDGSRTSGIATVSITVRPVNDAPTLSPIADPQVNEGERLEFVLSATDVDGDRLSFAADHLPPGARLDARSGRFSWEPGYDRAGTYPGVELRACDHGNPPLCAAQGLTITVVDPEPPRSRHRVEPPPNARGWVNSEVELELSASDDNGKGEVRGIHYAVDGGRPRFAARSKLTLTLSGDGPHALEYWAEDDAGNVENAHNRVRVNIDTTVPDVEEVRCYTDSRKGTEVQHGEWTNQATLYCEWTDPGSPSGDAFYYELNHGSGNTIGFSSESQTTENHVKLRLPGEADDWWFHVAAQNGAGTEGPQGRPRKMRIKLDHTPPRVRCEMPDPGWHARDVKVVCEASDRLSGLANPGDVRFALSTHVPEGAETADALTESRLIADEAGNTAAAGPFGPFGVDRRPPRVSCGSADDRWHAHNRSVTCTATDGGSGVAGEAVAVLRTRVPKGAETDRASTGTHLFEDAVGNVSPPVGPFAFKVDRKPPEVVVDAVEGVRGERGWFVSDVLVTFRAEDGGSGVADPDRASFVRRVRGEGTALRVASEAVRDAVGNVNPGVVAGPFKVDRTPPQVTGTPDREPDSNGWYNREVTVRWSASDNLSPTSCDPPVVVRDGGASIRVEGRCTDEAGNRGRGSTVLKLDRTPCELTLRFLDRDDESAPAEEAFLLRQEVTVAWSARDTLSGVELAIATEPDGARLDTGSIGERVFRVDAWDLAGNRCSMRRTYRVRAQVADFQPVRGVYPVGERVRLAFRLVDAYGGEVTDAEPTLTAFKLLMERDQAVGRIPVPKIWTFSYREGAGLYALDLETAGLDPGVYDLMIRYGGDQRDVIRITLEEQA